MPFRAADPLKIPIDSNGNLTAKTEGTDNWVYTWNAENQLTKVEKNGVEQARYAYDPNGRRVEKVAAGVTTAWTYDDDEILREVRGTSVVKYIHGPRTDEPLAVDDGSALKYLHADGLGSVVKSTTATGAVELTREYDAWGKPLASEGEPGFAFTGREWDVETALYYNRARYYAPQLGRFISEDPVGFDAGVDFYVYVSNRPVNFRDPSGLAPQCEYQMILVTAYCDKGPGKDWNWYKPTKKGGPAGNVGPGTCAMANTNPPPWPFGTTATVFGGAGNGTIDYDGTIHDTGAGWDCKHHCVLPNQWLDIWMPSCKEARKWGKQWRMVLICRWDNNGCDSCKK